jgi:GNAT superfamily N-acetyltransferase
MLAGMATIRRIESAGPRVIEGLCAVLIDAVQDGASVGFLAPLSRETALRYWNQALTAAGDGLVLWIAESGGEVVGTVQLALCAKENGRHRAELQKLLVLRSHRGNGIATALMLAADEYAAANGRRLLVLDTIAGSPAESVYRHLGWRKAGEIPEYAAMPDGELRATAYYYKQCPPGREIAARPEMRDKTP